MALDWLKEPISEDAPCGPDLERADDAEFVEYYFEAEGRLPERYFIPGMRSGRDGAEGSDDKLFDPKSVDIKKERAAIEGLLKRSYDLRLLSLMARWEVLAGRTTGFADAIEAMAALLEDFTEHAHPVIGSSNSDRRGAIDNLTTPVTSTIPLQYVSLTGEAGVTFRLYQVATGAVTARAGESDQSSSAILDALKNEGNKAKVTKTQEDLTRAADGLFRIQTVCKAHPDKPMSLDFDDLLSTIAQIQDLIQSACPDLEGWSRDGAAAAVEDDAPQADETAGEALQASDADHDDATAAPVQAVADAGPAGEVANQAGAKVTLEAVERYLRQREPSSAALLLVTQARLLIGKPLIEALETLLPEESRRAVIDFGPATGFALNMDRLRSLSGEAAAGEDDTPAPAPPQLATRSDVASNIRSVENYFRANEPTSPVPTLLVRARSYLDKDFDAIVAELIPTAPKEDS